MLQKKLNNAYTHRTPNAVTVYISVNTYSYIITTLFFSEKVPSKV